MQRPRVARCYFEGSGVPLQPVGRCALARARARDGTVEAQVLLSALCIRGLVKCRSGAGRRTDRLFMADTTGEPDFEQPPKGREARTRAGSAEGQALLAYILTSGPNPCRDLEGAHPVVQTGRSRWLPAGPSRLCALAGARGTDERRRQQMAEPVASRRRGRVADSNLFARRNNRAGGREVKRDPACRKAIPARG